MARKTKSEAQETRNQILDAAEEVFLGRGVARSSLQDIAQAAGVTRGAIYWHFEDKAALFMALMDRGCLPCETAMDEALADASLDALQQLHRMACGPMHTVTRESRVERTFRIAMHLTEYTEELGPVRQRQSDAIDGFIADMVAQLRKAEAAGLIRSGLDLDSAALGLFALLDGLMKRWTGPEADFDLAAAGEQAVGLYLDGLRRR